MPSLYRALEVIFLKRRCEDVIDYYLSNASGKCYDLTDKDRFVTSLAFELPNENYEDAQMVYRQFREKWSLPDPDKTGLWYHTGDSVYNAWLNYVANMIHLQNNQPVCRYRFLSEWHRLNCSFGEDMATTAYLASVDLQSRKQRNAFDWSSCLNHDSRDLQVMMSKKMVDLHAHLYATTENFELNWICLMNHVRSRGGMMRRFDAKHLSPTLEMAYHDNHRRLHTKVMIAAAIRLFLNSLHHGDKIMPYKLLLEVLSAKSETETALLTTTLQGKIDLTANIYSWNHQRQYDKHSFRPDYAIEKNVKETALTPLVGERKLMYDTFRHVYQGQSCSRESELLYIYLLIKSEVRKEMILQGKMKGFNNFGKYNARKYSMINDYPHYVELAERMAIVPFFDGYGDKRYMELRVKPEGDRRSNTKYIQRIERNIKSCDIDPKKMKGLKFDFVFHFIKCEDDTIRKRRIDDNPLSSMQCRHDCLRKKLKYQAIEIGAMQFGSLFGKTRKYPYNSLLIGIDAASTELVCRPEVFAQTFRYLKTCTLKNYDGKEYDLGRTFHVGEVFFDVVDGLRAIDEVMKFLEFGNGDRLGHATVLGIDVKKYYERHDYRINCTKQNLLDNLAWLYVKIQRWINEKTAFCAYLYEEYSKQFREVYGWKGDMPDVFTYYQSWLLRGDNPYGYSPRGPKETKLYVHPWDRNERSTATDVKEARKNRQASQFYWQYHFDKEVKVKGNEVTLYKIHDRYREEWADCVEIIREQLLCKVERKHISIECNPTSNIRIGEVMSYEGHPIVKFFNHGLIMPYSRHNICVSINTDDKGILATSLEREYSMMALSLEKSIQRDGENSPREILNWLNQVRKMSQEQIFNKDAIG